MKNSSQKICVLGATGYVGGRLVPRLLEEGHRVWAVGRSKEKLRSRPWAEQKDVVLLEADVFDPESLRKALIGCDVVYYLVHSMGATNKDFAEEDRRAAENTAAAAKEVGVKRIIYLGGLGEDSPRLSKHLRSRSEVADILKRSGVPTTVLRAAMIIGSGSASFEILRYLVEHLPVMITPKWVFTRNQPIAIRNVIEYLAGCLKYQETAGQSFDIGGEDILTYQDLMRIYAEAAGLPRRVIIPVPFLTPRLSSLWIHLVTPVPSYIARPLTAGLCNPVVCKDNRIRMIVPQRIFSCREAIEKALLRTRTMDIRTSWSDAGSIPPVETKLQGDPDWAGGLRLRDKRTVLVNASVEKVWKILLRIGGRTGWYHGNWLWAVRGWMDRLIGGVGLRRGRRSSRELIVGDALDFWRVVSIAPQDHLMLFAEMKLPGRAFLKFRLIPAGPETVELEQTASFEPKGLFGLIYWYSLVPAHAYVFGGMIRAVKNRAENVS